MVIPKSVRIVVRLMASTLAAFLTVGLSVTVAIELGKILGPDHALGRACSALGQYFSHAGDGFWLFPVLTVVLFLASFRWFPERESPLRQ